MHQNPATGVKPRPSGLAATDGDLLQNSDRFRLFMTIREFGRVVEHQNPVAAAGQEPLASGGKMAGKDIRLADSSVAKEPVSRLRVGPVLACPRRYRSCFG
jgi:hypothetical protein